MGPRLARDTPMEGPKWSSAPAVSLMQLEVQKKGFHFFSQKLALNSQENMKNIRRNRFPKIKSGGPTKYAPILHLSQAPAIQL